MTDAHAAIQFADRCIERNSAALARLSDMIFYFGELGMQEFRTSELLTTTLEAGGFEVERQLSGFPTGFLARAGHGGNVIALHCEFDGNPNNSQVSGVTERKEIVPGAPGHCEGHNVNAAVTVVAALAIKAAMDRFRIPGTLKLFGAPAEEQLVSRPYYVRDGHFRDVDIAFHAHIMDEFRTEYGLMQLGMMSVQFTFLGMTAHAATSPWEGRDALDAAVLMDVGMAQFREHMKPGMSAHRVFTEGGAQPNVIPARTTCWWFFRDRSPEGVRALFEQGQRIAQGAAMMANCQVETTVMSGVWPVRGNETIARTIQRHIEAVGMPVWTEAEHDFARALQKGAGKAQSGLRSEIAPLTGPCEPIMASNDCGDISWVVPMGRVWFPGNIPGRRVPSLVGRRRTDHVDRPQGCDRRRESAVRFGARFPRFQGRGRGSLADLRQGDCRCRIQAAAARGPEAPGGLEPGVDGTLSPAHAAPLPARPSGVRLRRNRIGDQRMETSTMTRVSCSLSLSPFGWLSAIAAAACVMLGSPATSAQEYPSRNIRLVVPFPAGGGTDTVARILVQKMSDALKQTIIIDNVGGASGSLGHEAVARAQPDGHTLLMATASTIATNPLISKVPWDPVKSFTPIAMLTIDPLPLVLNPSVPASNVRELVALAKEKPGGLTMASFGIGSVPHLAGELFNIVAGTKMLHVPYKGGAQALNDVVGGHVSLMFNSVGGASGAIAAGQVKLIAVGAPQRSPGLPNTPTVKELGLPEFEATTWIGLYGPANLPKPIVDRLSREIAAILKQPDLQERMGKMGMDTRSGTPEELIQTLDGDLKRWGQVVREGKIQAQ